MSSFILQLNCRGWNPASGCGWPMRKRHLGSGRRLRLGPFVGGWNWQPSVARRRGRQDVPPPTKPHI